MAAFWGQGKAHTDITIIFEERNAINWTSVCDWGLEMKSGRWSHRSRGLIRRPEAHDSLNLGAYLSWLATCLGTNTQRWRECIVQGASNRSKLIHVHGEQVGVATERCSGESANDNDIVYGNLAKQGYAITIREC